MFKLAPWLFLQLTRMSTVLVVQAKSNNPLVSQKTAAPSYSSTDRPSSYSYWCQEGRPECYARVHTFTIAFSGSGTSFDGQYAVKSSDDGIFATSQASAATFTLDSSCYLQDITDGHPLGWSASHSGESDTYAYLLDPALLQYSPSSYSRATCSVATTGEISQWTEFFANSPYLFYGTDSFTGLPQVTLTAVLPNTYRIQDI